MTGSDHANGPRIVTKRDCGIWTNSTVKLAPSILAADFAHLGKHVGEAEQAGADRIHVDVMDGHFVPNISMGVPIVESLRRVTRLPLEIHLMISDPDFSWTRLRRLAPMRFWSTGKATTICIAPCNTSRCWANASAWPSIRQPQQ